MKKIKITAIIVSMVICVCMMAACDFEGFLSDLINNNVYPYSENGAAEIEVNYAAFNSSEEVSIACSFLITVDDMEEYTLTYYKDTSEDTIKEKCIYEKGDTVLTHLIVGQDEYYIDESSKNVYQNSTSIFDALTDAVEIMERYGIVNLEDNEQQPLWTFVLKEDAKTAVNAEGASEEFVCYTYTSVEPEASENSVEMRVYFIRKLIPMIALLDYTIKTDGVETGSVTIYSEWLEILEDTFRVPTVGDGYSFIE
jgi:hypothetical protein